MTLQLHSCGLSGTEVNRNRPFHKLVAPCLRASQGSHNSHDNVVDHPVATVAVMSGRTLDQVSCPFAQPKNCEASACEPDVHVFFVLSNIKRAQIVAA